MNTKYSSFEEIDTRLKILKLQRSIDQEGLKVNLNSAKINLVPPLLVKNLGTGLIHSKTWKNVLFAFLVKKALNLLHKVPRKEG